MPDNNSGVTFDAQNPEGGGGSGDEIATVRQPKSLQKSINESLEYTRNHEGFYWDGENKTTNHQVYEMNEFYIEMVERLKKLSLDYTEEDDFEEEAGGGGEDGDSVLSEVVNAIKKKRNDPEIRRQIEAILKLDVELDTNYETLKNEKLDRESVQDQLCEVLQNEPELDKHSEMLYQLCKLDKGNRRHESKNGTKQRQVKAEKLSVNHRTKRKEKMDDNNKFIQKNIELAKNSTEMGNMSLTDEEKIKLEALLVDVDSVVDDLKTAVNPEEDDPDSTGYHFDGDEKTLIQDLDEKLKDFENEKEETSYDEIDRDKDDKFWKIEQRLRNIEEELLTFQLDKDKCSEDGNGEETIEIGPNLLKCMPEIEPTEDVSEMAMRLVECYEQFNNSKEAHVEEVKEQEELECREDGGFMGEICGGE